MSASAKNLKVVPAVGGSGSGGAGGKGPGGIPLYYKNVGLFSDPFLDELAAGRLKDPFLLRGWDTEGLPQFSAAYEWMLQYWKKYREYIPNWSEAELEAKWVRPLLEQLGWVYQAQVRVSRYGKREIPDYALFDSEKSYGKAQKPYEDENYDAFFSHVLAVADAKKCGVSLDGSKQDNTNPSYQIVWYQKITGKRWGILTDGVYWRLYSAESKNKFSSYYEVNVSKFLEERDDEAFKYFFNFFCKDAFVPDQASSQSFLDVVFANGERYAAEVERDLKDRAFHLVEMICQGFLDGSKQTKTEEYLAEVYQHSLYYLFRLLFILNSEAKGLLNVGSQSDYYPHSLRKLCEDIRSESERNQRWASAPLSYNRIRDLFELIRTGDERIGIHGLGDEVFSSGNQSFFKNHRLPDQFLNQVLLELSCQRGKDRKWRFVDYKRLSADHIGSIFEGLLEFSLHKVGSDYSLMNSSGERKATGAYYTPDYVVDFIVQETLAPIIETKSAKEVLSLKCADIAMGSGHFLLGVVRYLEEAVLEKIALEKSSSIDPMEVRWSILHNCIYGFDINPLAVELAKFSLWMYTARAGFQLEPLNDQLVCMNSLTNPTTLRSAVEIKDGFDAVVGNPPYVRQETLVKEKEELEARFATHHSMADLYVYFIEQSHNLISNNGRIGLITANKWLKAEYGKPLREWLTTKNVEQVVDFGDLPVFPGIAAYPAITFLSGGKKLSASVSYTKVRELPADGAQLARPTEFIDMKRTELSGSAWTFEGQEAKRIMTKISKLTSKLSEVTGDAYRGILTGCNEAFVIDESTAKGLIKADPKAAEIIRPFSAGKEIQRYGKINPKKFLIVARRGVEIKKYPTVLKHLQQYKDALMPRPKDHKGEWSGRKPGKYEWFELQDTVDYIGLFKKPKISFLVFQVRPSFTFDRAGTLNNNAVWNLDTDDLVLLGFLNSRLGWYLISKHCTQIQGGFQLIYKYLSQVPVIDRKKLASNQVREIESLVKSRLECGAAESERAIENDRKLDEAFYALFSITSSERALVESVPWGGGARAASNGAKATKKSKRAA